MQDTETIELQTRELNRLCDTGFHFEIQLPPAKPARGLRRLLQRQAPSSESTIRRLEIHQPTLATLDRIAPHMRQLAPAVETLKQATDDTILTAAKQATVYARDMALIIAILVLGEDLYDYDPRTNRCHEDHKRLQSLHRTILHSLTPARMLEICQAILAVCNLPDFSASIRLLAAETEQATPVEERIE